MDLEGSLNRPSSLSLRGFSQPSLPLEPEVVYPCHHFLSPGLQFLSFFSAASSVMAEGFYASFAVPPFVTAPSCVSCVTTIVSLAVPLAPAVSA